MWLSKSSNTYSTINEGRSCSSSVEISDFESNDDDDDNNEEENSVDPRVQEELERLNNATDVINKLEVELDDARAAFRHLLSESTHRINSLAKRLGTCVEKARPYYEARIAETEAHAETQKAALRFEKANGAHSAAKEMVFLAEEGLRKDGRTFDPVWQEMLNHATMRVNEAESERTLSEQEHRRLSKAYNETDKVVQELKKDLKKQITKSSLSARRNLLQINDLAHQHQLLLLPYFEMKAQFNKLMKEQKRRVEELEENILRAKQSYADALHNLEEISDEIHRRRKSREERLALGDRGTGVGAEHPEPSLRPECDTKRSSEANDLEAITGGTFAKLPDKLRRLPKSVSSSMLSQLTEEDRANVTRNGNHQRSLRLRKSKSVIERTEVGGTLFGRYSIGKNRRLQVDSGSQTEEQLSPSREISSSPSIERRRLNPCEGFDRLDVPRKRSIKSSPSAADTKETKTLFVSDGGGEDGETSDSESIASVDCLTDEQISSLMLDKELEEVVHCLRWKTTFAQCSNESSSGHNEGLDDGGQQQLQSQTTQTVKVREEEEEDVVDSEDEVTVVETIEVPPPPPRTTN